MKEIRVTMTKELQQNSLLNQKGSVFYDGNDAIANDCVVADAPSGKDSDISRSTPPSLLPVCFYLHR